MRHYSWRKVNLAQFYLWTAFLLPANLFGWVSSVKLISNLSIVALSLGALAAWRADVPNKKEDGDG